MVGRSTRRSWSKEDSNDEQEFVSLSSISNKRKKGKNSSQEDEDDDILNGFDIEGLTEREKEELKRVVLESRSQIPHQCIDPVEEKSSNVSSVQDIEPKSPRDIYAEDDDDETQPPEDMDVELDFDLGESTLVDMDENTEEIILEGRDVSAVKDVKSHTCSNISKDRSVESSQSFEPIRDEETEIDCEKKSETSHRTPSNSQKSSQHANLSQESKFAKQSNSRISAAGSSHSQYDSKIDAVHVPLRRHYRAVSTQTVKNDDYFYTRDNTTSQNSVKAIIQLFEIFRMKLKAAQSQCRDKIPWGDPVKPGNHQSRTIDIKRRGQDSFYIELSEDENEDVEMIPESTNDKETMKHGSQSLTNSDDDFPELLIEESNKSETLGGRSSRKKNWNKTMEIQSKVYETSQSDLNKDTDNDFEELKQKNDGRTRRRDDKVDTDDFDKHIDENSDGKKSRKPRVNKKTDVTVEVLVEETQEEDIDFEEIISKSKEKADITVSETQIDGEEDYVEVGTTADEAKKTEFLAKKIPYSRKHDKKIDDIEEIPDNSENNPFVVVDILEKKKKGSADKNKDKKIINPMKRKKRKAKKIQNEVLVEETPDLDADCVATKIENKRIKRQCFKLGSSSEDENVPETQEMDVIENQSDQENARCCIVDLIDDENETDDKNNEKEETKNADNQASLDTNSQSPIIKKSKKQCVSNTKKGYSGSIGLDKGNEINTDALKEFPCEKKVRSVEGNRTNARKGRMLKDSALDSVDSTKGDIPKGVKNLFNRPLSKESIDSNVSDDLSTTSSQRSSMIIDEQGDLYSTQYCEIKGRKRKKVGHTEASNSNISTQRDDILEEVMTLEDSSDVDMSKPKRDRCDVSINKKKTRRTSVPIYPKKIPKVEKISRFFGTKVEGTSSRMPIDLDSDSDGDNNGMEGSECPQKNSQAIPGLSSSKGVKSETSTSIKKTRITLQDKAIVQKVERVKKAINQTTGELKPITRNSKNKAYDKKQRNETDGDGFKDHDQSSDPVVNESDEDDVVEVIKEPNIKEKRNIELNVDQTETSAEFVNDNCEDVLQRRGVVKEDTGDVIAHRGQGRKRQHTEGKEAAKVASKLIEIKTTVCPLCDCPFPDNIIEAHAADCDGTVQDGEEIMERSAPLVRNDNLEHQQMAHSSNQRSAREQLNINQHSEPVDEKEFDALKQLSDTGQEGEPTTCWICECLIKEEYDMHVKKCYQEAAKQQREIEEQGYRETRQEQDEWSPLKGTRSRLRIQQEGGDMLRPKMNNVKVTRSKWNVNENSERADRHGPTTRQGRSARKTKPEQTVTYKAAMEDGYNSGKIKVLDSSESTDGSSWDNGSSSDSSDDDNIPLYSVVRAGSSALITGPWNKQSTQSKTETQSKKCNGLPDWIKDGINSPIKSFVPISQQEDSEYFQNQFSHKQKNVEKRMQKRKRTQGKKRRRKRRKVRRSKNQ